MIISDWRLEKIGVLQKGSLSLVLFIIHIDELGALALLPQLKFTIYADDLHLFVAIKMWMA